MKFVTRWAFRLLILVIVLIVAGLLLKDTIAKSIAENRIRAETGLEAKIGKLEIGLFNPTLSIEDLKLYNNADFGGSPLLDVAELHVEYDRDALANQKVHLKLLRLNLSEIYVVRNKAGKSNLGLAKLNLWPEGQGKTDDKALKFAGIDTLNLTLGKVKQTTLDQTDKPVEFNLGINNAVVTGLATRKDFEDKLTPILLRAVSAITSQAWPDGPTQTKAPKAAPDTAAVQSLIEDTKSLLKK